MLMQSKLREEVQTYNECCTSLSILKLSTSRKLVDYFFA